MEQNITPITRTDFAPGYLEWPPIVLGAFAAAALSSVFELWQRDHKIEPFDRRGWFRTDVYPLRSTRGVATEAQRYRWRIVAKCTTARRFLLLNRRYLSK